MLAFDDTGDGVPVVLLHGLGSDRRPWDPIRDRLGDGIRCIAVDPVPRHLPTLAATRAPFRDRLLGHWLHLVEPDRFAARLRSWIRCPDR